MAVSIGAVSEFPDGEIIGDEEALESELLAGDTSRRSHLLACDGTPSTSLYDGITLMAPPFCKASLNVNKRSFAQHAHRRHWPERSSCRTPAGHDRRSVSRWRSASLVAKGGIALKAAHRSNAQARDQIRIFAVGFFHPPPTRIARNIDHRRQEPGGRRAERASRAVIANSDSISSGLKVPPSAIGCGKLVPSMAQWPCRHSS